MKEKLELAGERNTNKERGKIQLTADKMIKNTIGGKNKSKIL